MTVGAVLCDTAQPTVYAVVSIAQNLKSQKPKKSFQYVSLGFPPKKCQVVKNRQPARLSLLFPDSQSPERDHHGAELCLLSPGDAGMAKTAASSGAEAGWGRRSLQF